jgi:hypothetical protein
VPQSASIDAQGRVETLESFAESLAIFLFQQILLKLILFKLMRLGRRATVVDFVEWISCDIISNQYIK